jgi:hypothetical protein
MRVAKAAASSGDRPVLPWIGVSMAPGLTALTRMPLSQEFFRIGPCRVGVRFKSTFLSSPSPSKRQLKVDVDAPLGLEIYREEIRMQRSQVLGQSQPTVPAWEWLRRANASVSCGLVA